MFRLIHRSARCRLLQSLVWTLAWTLTCATNTSAQSLSYATEGRPEDPGLGLLQEEPHDLLFFTEQAGGGWAKAPRWHGLGAKKSPAAG